MWPLQVNTAARRHGISYARSTVQYLQRDNVNFTEPNVAHIQPGSESGGLCSLDALPKMVYHCKSFKSVQELKSATVTAWQKLSQAFLHQSISKWQCCLENIVAADK